MLGLHQGGGFLTPSKHSLGSDCSATLASLPPPLSSYQMSSRAMLSRLVAVRSLAGARPRVPVLRRNSTTVAAPSAPTPTASTEKLPPDDRPFVIRYKWAILLTTAFGSWVSSSAPRRHRRPLHLSPAK